MDIAKTKLDAKTAAQAIATAMATGILTSEQSLSTLFPDNTSHPE